jgi:hypothetical protein
MSAIEATIEKNAMALYDSLHPKMEALDFVNSSHETKMLYRNAAQALLTNGVKIGRYCTCHSCKGGELADQFLLSEAQ